MVAEPNWAALAIPIFLGGTLLEAYLAKRRKRSVYAFSTAVADLACGSTFLAVELVLKIGALAAYAWLFDRRVIDWSGSLAWVPWVLGIVGVDFMFYLWHRASHVVNVLWAVHGVHHQSEDYNLAVALRQPMLEPITWFFFYAPLALLGVSPVVYLVAYAINRLYQFWIHTELVRRLPAPLEWLLNTPSHHRVHHGVQPQYLDKNYGAVLIVWDRWLGTFEPEVEPPRYGTTVPLRSYNPLWANIQHFVRIAQLASAAATLREAIWAPIAHPAWVPRGFCGDAPKVVHPALKYRPASLAVARAYVLFHFGLAALALTFVVFCEHAFAPLQLATIAAVLVAGFTAGTGLLEGKLWAVRLELWRLVGFIGVAAWLLSDVAQLSTLGLRLAAVAGALVLGASVALLRGLRATFEASSLPVCSA